MGRRYLLGKVHAVCVEIAHSAKLVFLLPELLLETLSLAPGNLVTRKLKRNGLNLPQRPRPGLFFHLLNIRVYFSFFC
jgi:hypothetical protein